MLLKLLHVLFSLDGGRVHSARPCVFSVEAGERKYKWVGERRYQKYYWMLLCGGSGGRLPEAQDVVAGVHVQDFAGDVAA